MVSQVDLKPVRGYAFNSDSYKQLEIWAAEIIIDGVQGTNVGNLVDLLDLERHADSVVEGALRIACFPEKTRWLHEKIDLSHVHGLEVLMCDENGLTGLDLNHLTSLDFLLCSENKLTNLDLTHTTRLKVLACSSNQLEALTLSSNPMLTKLFCSYNTLRELDLSHTPKLRVLNVNGNNLADLDLAYAPNLERLECEQTCLPEQSLLSSIFGCFYVDSIPKQKIKIGYSRQSSQELSETTTSVLASLTEREEQVLRMRFGIGLNEPRTWGEVGEVFQITREQVREIENVALRKLKHPSRSRKLRKFHEDITILNSPIDESRAKKNAGLDAINNLLKLSFSRGYVNASEIDEAFPEEMFEVEEIDKFMSLLAKRGVKVVIE